MRYQSHQVAETHTHTPLLYLAATNNSSPNKYSD